MNQAAIFFLADGYVTSSPKLMGRQAAGESFLRAAARSGASRLVCHAPTQHAAKQFAGELARHGFTGQAGWIPTDTPDNLATEGCLYLPGPNIGEFAWRRAPYGDRSYSLCGVTHTTASHTAMTAITDLLVTPVRGWDALICTSTSVRDTARFLLERQAEYLRERLGASRFELPQLPIIPLGVHCEDYDFAEDEKSKARQALGIGADEVVFLFVGRLSFHAKAHPQQMYTALERAAKGRHVRLIECGWFANEHIESAFKEGADALCPSIATLRLDGRQPAIRRQAWAAADIFISLSDNIQETFGLTPIEAMAAGLPVIVTDWDGYKDTVRDSIDGFRIPTLMPPAPLGEDLARRHDNGQDTYDMYCGYASQFTAVDPIALETACDRLIGDSALRKQMGESGKARARQQYDWAHIYQRYINLWDELAERRRADPDLHPAPRTKIRPDRADPFAAFATYPTTLLSDTHKVILAPNASAAMLSSRSKLGINSFAHAVHLPENDCFAIFKFLQEKPHTTVQEIASLFPAKRRKTIARGLVWLAKMEAIHITPVAADTGTRKKN